MSDTDDEGMSKYGVVTEDPAKTAAHASTCSKCGAVIPRNTNINVPWCPTCGTEPFEKKP